MPEVIPAPADNAPEPSLARGATAPAPQSFDWKSQIPAEYKTEKDLESVKDIPTLVKNYVERGKFVGNSIRLPNEKDKPEDRQRKIDDIYNKLGRPESPDKYQVELPKLDDRYGGWHEERITGFKQLSHRIGLNNGQVGEVLKWYATTLDDDSMAADEAYRQSETQLREEFGGAYDRKIALGQRVIAKYGGEGVLNALTKYGLDNNADVVRMFANLGQLLAEDNLITGHVEGISSPDDAKKKIADIMNDAKGAYRDANHPQHAEAVKSMTDLIQLAYQS